MDRALLTAMLLFPLSGVRAEGAAAERPLHVAAMVGLVSVPRPVDAAVLLRIVDLVGIGFGYSDFPAFIANPLLDLAGAKSGTTDARLDQFDAFELDLRVFPFRGSFFAGSSFGRQSLKGAVTEATAFGPQTATVDSPPGTRRRASAGCGRSTRDSSSRSTSESS